MKETNTRRSETDLNFNREQRLKIKKRKEFIFRTNISFLLDRGIGAEIVLHARRA